MPLVRRRTTHILAVENITARPQGIRMSSNPIKGLTADAVAPLPLSADGALAIKANRAIIAALKAPMEVLEERRQEPVRLRAEYDWLTSVPGIGRILATTLLLETGPIERLVGVGHFTSYARGVDRVRTRNGKKKGEGNPKNGNPYLAWAFVEAANFARRYGAEAKRFYERKPAKTNPVVAVKALAHQLARACYPILKEGQPFDVKRCFA